MRLNIAAPLLLAVLLPSFFNPAECLDGSKLIKGVDLEPENVLVTFPSDPCGDFALVEWDPPSKDFLIESYRVSCEAADFSDRVVDLIGADSTDAVIGPLQLNSTYRCFVASRSKLYGSSRPVASEPFSTSK